MQPRASTAARFVRSRLALAVAVGCAVLLPGCAGGGTVSGSADALSAGTQQIPLSERVTVAEVEGRLLDGSRFDSGSLDRSVTVVNVWGSWCGPCRVEAPALRETARRFDSRGVNFLGLNVRDNDAAASAFEDRFKIPYPSIGSEDSARAGLAFGGQLTTAAVPMTVVLDRQRRVAARVVGTVTEATLAALIEDVLAEGR